MGIIRNLRAAKRGHQDPETGEYVGLGMVAGSWLVTSGEIVTVRWSTDIVLTDPQQDGAWVTRSVQRRGW